MNWTNWWTNFFIKALAREVVFSWTFVGLTACCVLLYIIWVIFRSPDRKGKGLFNLGLFKFNWRDVLVCVGLSGGAMILIACISWTAAVHAASFGSATERRCLKVEESSENYIFTIPGECEGNALLWNRVEIDKAQSQPVKDFLEQQK